MKNRIYATPAVKGLAGIDQSTVVLTLGRCRRHRPNITATLGEYYWGIDLIDFVKAAFPVIVTESDSETIIICVFLSEAIDRITSHEVVIPWR